MLLDGIKVIELGQFIFVPYCATHLADFGAEIIKIENPAGGDPMRFVQRQSHLPDVGINYYFDQNNRGKKSLALDVNQAKGQEIVRKLVQRGDIFMTNFQVETLKRMRLDYETLSKVNPRLIYALGTGYGTRGPDRNRGGFDFGVWARTGLMASLGEPGTPQVQCQPGFGDHVAAMNLFAAIGLALYHRERTGEGQLVHVSLYGSLLDAGSSSLQAALATDHEVAQKDRLASPNPLCNSYVTKDGKWLMISSKQPDRNWHDFCAALGLETLENDPRFKDTASRANHCRELISILDSTFARLTMSDVEQRLKGRNVHWSPSLTYGQVAKDPQVWENNYVAEVTHPQFGPFKTWTNSLEFSRTPFQVRSGTAELGQHNEEILLGLGYTWEDIGRLKDGKVIV
ncbi:MAG: CoA transferase [Chloroflexi bacterium]|nr:CoA transferase [Chloroflexota bacterium]